MFDENFDRAYQHSRSDLNAGIDRGIARFSHAVANAFRTLEAIQYESPWSGKPRRIPHDA